MLASVGWAGERLAVRPLPGRGQSRASPRRWMRSTRRPTSTSGPGSVATAAVAADGHPTSEAPSSPLRPSGCVRRSRRSGTRPLLAIHEAARERGVTFLAGEGEVSVGSGAGVVRWPVDALPEPCQDPRGARCATCRSRWSPAPTARPRSFGCWPPWRGARAGPPASAPPRASRVQGRTVAEGDFSGPEGARLVLRHREVETAVLETARGGLLRRGLPVERADVAVVTNIAADHLGEFGVRQPRGARGDEAPDSAGGGPARPGRAERGRCNAGASGRRPCARRWCGSRSSRKTRSWRATWTQGGRAAVLRGRCAGAGRRRPPGGAGSRCELPIAAGGAARYNVANALAAAAAAEGLGVPADGDARDALPLRARPVRQSRARQLSTSWAACGVVVDYAHNPHGIAALAGALDGCPPTRRRWWSSGRRGTGTMARSARWHGPRSRSGPTGWWRRRWMPISAGARRGRSPGSSPTSCGGPGCPRPRSRPHPASSRRWRRRWAGLGRVIC